MRLGQDDLFSPLIWRGIAYSVSGRRPRGTKQAMIQRGVRPTHNFRSEAGSSGASEYVPAPMMKSAIAISNWVRAYSKPPSRYQSRAAGAPGR